MRRIVVLGLLGVSNLAHADAQADLGVSVDAGSVGLAAGASLDGDAAYGYRAESGGETSSYITGDAVATARVDRDGPGATFEQEAEARPYGFELFQLTFADRLGFDVAPKLSDPPDRWRRRYRHAGFDVDAICGQYLGKHFGAQIIRVDNGFDWEEQRDGTDLVHRYIETSDWAPFSFTRRSGGEEVGRLDPIALEAKAIDGASDGVVMTTFAPRLSHVVLGPVWLDAAYGYAATGWTQTSVNDQVVSTITSANLPAIHTPAWRGRLGWSGQYVEASAGAERNLHLTADSALVLEERASGDLHVVVAGTDVQASGFAARSQIWTSPTDSRRFVTGGGSLALDRLVRDGWHVAGSAEVARTFYAAIDQGRALEVDTAVRVNVGLRKQLRNWVPRGHQ